MKGFTLIELILAISIIAILFGLSTMNLLHAQNSTTVTTVEETLISDLKSQQTKAMNGTDSGGSFGIHFSSDSTYTLFQGTSYDPSSGSNSPITIDAITFSGNDVVFSSINGETTATTITVAHTNGLETKTIQLNKYGAVIVD